MNRYANWIMDTNTCSPPSAASTSCGSIHGGTDGGGPPNTSSSAATSIAIGNGMVVVSTNCGGIYNSSSNCTSAVSSTCNIGGSGQQITVLQPGTGLNTSGGTIQLVGNMVDSNNTSQQEDFVANSTSNNSAANNPQSK